MVTVDAADVLKGKWLLVMRNPSVEETYKQRLLAMKQARLILGRDQDRVVRVVISEDGRRTRTRCKPAGTVCLDAKSSALKDKPLPLKRAP